MGNDSKLGSRCSGKVSVKLELREIYKSYNRDDGKIDVLGGLSFDLRQGEILSVLGPSGCGKSTLLRLIAGFESPDSGEIFADGKRISKPGPDRLMIFQDFNQLFPWKTVIDNVVLPLKINGIGGTRRERCEISVKYLEMVELGGFINSYPHQLSGGMKQRAAIARALALTPGILLMDEPFGSLDAITRSSMQKMLLDIWDKTGVTIVFVTHDIQEAILLSDRMLVMSKDKSRAVKIFDNLLKRPRVLEDVRFSDLYRDIRTLL